MKLTIQNLQRIETKGDGEYSIMRTDWDERWYYFTVDNHRSDNLLHFRLSRVPLSDGIHYTTEVMNIPSKISNKGSGTVSKGFIQSPDNLFSHIVGSLKHCGL